MPFKNGISTIEARERITAFLTETECYDICAACPVYPGGEGCCHGCVRLIKGQGCVSPNLSCLSYTCGVLNEHLRRLSSENYANKLDELTDLLYGLPREGYRGCQRKPDNELLQIGDPLGVVAELRREKKVLTPFSKEK